MKIGPVVHVGRPDENGLVPVGIDFRLLVHDQRFGDAAPLGHERVAAPAAAVVAGDGGCDFRILALGNDLPGHILSVLRRSHFFYPFIPGFRFGTRHGRLNILIEQDEVSHYTDN